VVHSEASFKRVSTRLSEIALRLTPKHSPRRRVKPNHKTLHNFSLKREPLAWARVSVAQK